MIPKKIHYVFGLKEDFSLKEFSLVNYLCIKSAKQINPDYEIHLHYTFEPHDNEWWNKSKELVDYIHVLEDEYKVIAGQTVIHAEHIADLRRILILKEFGGVYLDVDVVCLKPFDPLLVHSTVMGVEVFGGNVNGLCNAVILAEQNSPFIHRYIDRFDMEFDPNDWNKMAVRLPYLLASEYCGDVHIEHYDSFFSYCWHSIIDLHCSHVAYTPRLENSYCIHLWQSKWYHAALRHMTIKDIESRDSVLNIIFRNILHSPN